MKVLVIDNNIEPDSWGAGELSRLARQMPGAEVRVRRAPQEDLPASSAGFDRVIVSGSKTSALEEAPWISRLLDFIRESVSRNQPYLGVCYGHQMLVRALGGKQGVRKAQEPEFGWTEIELTEPANSSLLQGLPRKFYSFSSHFDEVCELPNGMKPLARSRDCAIQAMQLGSSPVFGIQFHPEKDCESAEKSLLARKKLGVPSRLLHLGEGGKLYNAEIGATLFRNFLGP